MKKYYFFAFAFVSILKLNAQSQCGTDELDAYLKRTNPTYAAERQKFEDYIYKKISHQNNARFESYGCPVGGPLYTLPVVFHIIDTSSTTIATNTQITQALKYLNDAWRRVIGDGADMQIQFALAQRDPFGNATTGKERLNGRNVTGYLQRGVFADSNRFLVNWQEITNLSYWPRDQYINIYIVSKIEFAAGFGSPPGPFGGSICSTTANGNFGWILNHEMGHYFDLYHPFETVFNEPGNECQNDNCLLQGDRVCDTPPVNGDGDCNSISCPYTGDSLNSLRNYMSYCGTTTRFTEGQKNRVRATLFSEYRVNLISSPALIPTTTSLEVAIDSIEYTEDIMSPLCNHQLNPKIRLKNLGTTTISSVKMSVILAGNVINTSIYPVNILSKSTQMVNIPTITFTNGGSYDLSFQLLQINNSRIDYDTLNNQLCTSVNPLVFSDTTTTIADPPAGGSIIGGKIFKCNGIDTLKVSINSCYNFLGIYKNNIWGGSDDFVSSDTIAYITIEVNEFSEKNIIFKAKFEKKRYLILGYPSPSNNYGSVYGGGQYDCGTLINLLARPRTGYKFLNWTRNGIVYSTDSILSFTAAENLNLLAVFTLATGIKQTTINEISKIYPNPVKDILQIEIRSKQNTSITLNIIDMKGSLLETKIINNTKGTFNTSFDVSKLAKGNYILNLYDEEGMASYKFVVQ